METKAKIVITGGLGFIFSHVTEYFVKKGWEVVVIDNCSDGYCPEILDGSFKHYDMHMADPLVVNVILDENPDYLIHAAAISDVDYSVREPYRTLKKNILGNLHAFEAARGLSELKKFIYVSTDEVYGECEHRMREDELLAPRNPYSASKAAGSLMRIAYDNTFPVLKEKTAETRFCNVFGPRQDLAKVMPKIKKGILDQEYVIPVHNGGTGYREYLYVKNIPPAIELILEKGLGVYNITLNDGLTVHELIGRAEKISGKKVSTVASERPGMDMKYQMDPTRITELGWKPLYTFDEGLEEYLKL